MRYWVVLGDTGGMLWRSCTVLCGSKYYLVMMGGTMTWLRGGGGGVMCDYLLFCVVMDGIIW